MVRVDITYKDKKHEQPIYNAIQSMSKLFKSVKVEKEYRDKKGHNVVSVRAE